MLAPGPSRHFVAFDLETTGLDPATERVIEIGAVRFDETGRELDRFEVLVNPCQPISPSARAVHGIPDDALVDCPRIHEVLPDFLTFLGEATTTLLAHNAHFDASFLGHEFRRSQMEAPAHRVVDTLSLARRARPDLPRHRLDALAEALNLESQGQHRALADSLRVKELWLSLNGSTYPAEHLVAYSLNGVLNPARVPLGWDRLAEAIARGQTVRMNYLGGTRGATPREVTPRGVVHRGGVAYLVAYCHLDDLEKSFRLDRVQRYDVVK
ncbi:MAG: exonuclease domain-containing protein [Isosphaeraceae bacterium]